jgi:hypothetical protein
MKKLNWRERIEVLVRGQLTTWVENDTTFTQSSSSLTGTVRDRYDADRSTVLQDALDAWRLNPLARRVVGLTTQYVVGGGVNVGCKHPETHKFLQEFWKHRLNHMDVRCYELCDELTRSGNLFLLLSTDSSGMTYIRPVPAADIDKIDAKPNDIEQPVRFWPKASGQDLDPEAYPAYDQETDSVGEDGVFPVAMLHYTINRPVGGQWGESDLAPSLKWLSRYSNWLEDRARLNRFRNSFLFVVKSKFTSETERQARQTQLAANPPQPGSILVSDESETWEVLSPKLESNDAATDGLALKKMLAAGAGVPMHFLAEPEGSTRTTAEAAGGPTFRHFEQRQNYFIWLIEDLLKIVVRRRAMVAHDVSVRAELLVRGADISARDNVALSMAAQNVGNMLADLRDRQLITNAEYLRLAYRFAGEVVDVEDMLAAALKEGPPRQWSAVPGAIETPDGEAGRRDAERADPERVNKAKGSNDVIDTDTGEIKSKIAGGGL